MKKHIIITIRYSLFMKTAAWVTSLKPIEEYKAELLSTDRINTRELVFSKITLPSLIGLERIRKDDTNLTVHILTSTELPEKNKIFLNQIEKQHRFIKVIYQSYEDASVVRDLGKYLEEEVVDGEVYCSVRLDDDDGLSHHWLEEISSYLNPSFDGFVFSPSRGIGLVLNEKNQIQSLNYLGGRLLGCGLAYIAKKTGKDRGIRSIYECNDHTTIDHRFKTIIYAKMPYWIRSFNSYNDSNPITPKSRSIDPEKYLSELTQFNIIELPFELVETTN